MYVFLHAYLHTYISTYSQPDRQPEARQTDGETAMHVCIHTYIITHTCLHEGSLLRARTLQFHGSGGWYILSCSILGPHCPKFQATQELCVARLRCEVWPGSCSQQPHPGGGVLQQWICSPGSDDEWNGPQL